MTFTQAIENFSLQTGFHLQQYLRDYTSFIEESSGDIVNFYKGRISRINNKAFSSLDSLIERSVVLRALIEESKESLNTNTLYWEIFQTISDIDISLKTFTNMQKWTRSSITKSRVESGARVNTVLRSHQTLEDLSTELGSNHRDTHWLKIAFDNDLREEDYTSDGGTILSVSGVNKVSINLTSIIDTDIIGEKIYGRDINKRLTFVGEDDIETLSYGKTLLQTVGILSSLQRKDNPEFANQGLQSIITGNSNRASLPFPVIMRQYYSIFSTDDSFKSIELKNIEIVKDSLSLAIECETRIGESLTQQI